MKKLFLLAAMAIMTVTANAQFEEGKTYLGASASNIGFNYSKSEDVSLKANLTAGYFVMDNILAFGEVGTALQRGPNEFYIGAGGRYYIQQNGIYLGAALGYSYEGFGDVKPRMEVGYVYFLNRTVTLEPAIYYQHSFKDMDYSRVGLKLGVGINLETDSKGTSILKALRIKK